MNKKIPGTTLRYNEQAKLAAYSVVSPVIEATGGLTLSQLSKLTGLEGSTIQNWIKRGWVSTTVGKKYSDKQVIRILLINMLRGVMRLEDIAKLMQYVNGDVEDVSDDIITDENLYNILCKIIFKAEIKGAFEPDLLKRLIDAEISESNEKVKLNSAKLKSAIFIMLLAYRSAYLKFVMENEMNAVLNQ